MTGAVHLDIHVHTSPGSRCSAMSVPMFLQAALTRGWEALCVTNHGDMSDYDELVRQAGNQLLVIPGVEISSPGGDFLLFSTDLDFLRTLTPIQSLPAREDRPHETAVVWAHPFAGVPGADGVGEDYLDRTAAQVDGIEVYNGNWPDEAAGEAIRRLAESHGLARLGGSDAHRREDLMRCWTELSPIDDTAGLISAIKAGATKASRSR
ncbi:MAG: PHP domain-containing protein [Thermoleophilia bacterium]